MKLIEQDCLPPLANQFRRRISARAVKMDWKLNKIQSIRIVSHRASVLGEDRPDTAFRQVIFRIASTQTLTLSNPKSQKGPSGSVDQSRNLSRRAGGWKPMDAANSINQVGEQNQDLAADAFLDNGNPRTVVEYMILQKRVIDGNEEEWKVQGFTQESTPVSIEEDETYWRRMLAAQTTVRV